MDTCVWSLALRRSRGPVPTEARELQELIQESRAILLGPVRQELLSGVRDTSQYETLRLKLRGFPDVQLLLEDYERAAQHFNFCRAGGIQGSNTDFLLCAVSQRLESPIFTTDGDFQHYAKMLPLALHHSKL